MLAIPLNVPSSNTADIHFNVKRAQTMITFSVIKFFWQAWH